MCLSLAPPPRAWRGVGGLIPKWRKCRTYPFFLLFLETMDQPIIYFGGGCVGCCTGYGVFPWFLGDFLPCLHGICCVYPRTGPCVSKMFQFWETFANNTPKNRWGFLDWFSASGGPKVSKKRARWALFADCYKWSFSNGRYTGYLGWYFTLLVGGYNSVYNWLIWLEPTLSVPLLVSNSNFACAKFSSCFCCQFETFDSQTSQRSLPRKCGW